MIYAMSDIHGNYYAFKQRLKHLNDLDSVKTGKDKLILLGDYIDVGRNSFKVVDTIKKLQNDIGADNIIVLRGNHEEWFLEFLDDQNPNWILGDTGHNTLSTFLTDKDVFRVQRMIYTKGINAAAEKCTQLIRENHLDLIKWMNTLPYYYETDSQIFVHAGIDEDAEDMWKWGTSEHTYTGKWPATTGKFYKDIIAGHVSTSSIVKDGDYHDIYFDGENHYFIDGIDSYPLGRSDEERYIPVLVYDEKKKKYYSMEKDSNKLGFINY